MEVEHKIQMDTQNTSNLKQITALRMELQRAVELRKQKVSMQFFLTLYWHHNLWNMSCLVWCEKSTIDKKQDGKDVSAKNLAKFDFSFKIYI